MYLVDELSSEFFEFMVGLVELLHPFKEATDECQSNAATLYTFYNAFNQMKNHVQTMIQSNHILKQAAIHLEKALNNLWFKYVDNNIHTVILFFLFGRDAKTDAPNVVPAQKWLFQWCMLYFKGMSISFDG
jgi:regulator of replication initiation timing